MMIEGTNLLVLKISAFWSSSRWPLATVSQSESKEGASLQSCVVYAGLAA